MVGVFTFLLLFNQSLGEIFSETLHLEPLDNEKVFTEFEFLFQKTNFSRHYRVYPRTIHEVTSKLKISELHLSLSKGDSSDYQCHEKVSPPGGAFLLATFEEDEASVEDRWKSLVGVLAGLFCISLNQLDMKTTVSPPIMLPTFGPIDDLSTRRIGFLPREVACTENLTPWRKILPTGGTHGLLGLLNNPHYQQRKSFYWAVGMDYSKGDTLKLWHRMIVDVREVSSYTKLTSKNLPNRVNLTPKLLFGISNAPLTPLAEETKLVLVNSTTFSPHPSAIIPNKFEGKIDFSIPIIWDHEVENKHDTIQVFRKAGGGQGEGVIKTKFINSFDVRKEVMMVEVLPWWIKPRLSSKRLDNCEEITSQYSPANDAERKTAQFTIAISIPANSYCTISYDFRTAWPKWNEYPPDANHGRYLPPVIVFYEGDASQPRRTFSEALLIYVPIPDFSMPYNVLCLACTVLAMGIGSVHNLTTSQLVPSSTPQAETNLGKIISFVWNLLKRFKRENTEDSKEHVPEKEESSESIETESESKKDQ